MPNCTARRIFRFSKGLRIPTSWSSKRLISAIGPWPSPIATAWPAWSAPPGGQRTWLAAIDWRRNYAGRCAERRAAGDRSRVYGRLANLITTGRLRAAKGECQLAFDDLTAHQAGLLAGVILSTPDQDSVAPADHAVRWPDIASCSAIAVMPLAELHLAGHDERQI